MSSPPPDVPPYCLFSVPSCCAAQRGSQQGCQVDGVHRQRAAWGSAKETKGRLCLKKGLHAFQCGCSCCSTDLLMSLGVCMACLLW